MAVDHFGHIKHGLSHCAIIHELAVPMMKIQHN